MVSRASLNCGMALVGIVCLAAGTSGAESSAPYSGAIKYWVDPDTPESAHAMVATDGTKMILVGSDEFDEEGRTFASGEDKMWTALDTPDITNQAIEYLHPSMVTTESGNLKMTLSKQMMGGREYVGASIQSWNKFCFTGGIVVTRNLWPNATGTWPGAWMIGNLGRPQYEESCRGVWPFSYNICDKSPGASGQRISACNPNPGVGLNPNQGRGAPEIDILEAWASPSTYFFPSSYQVAPSLPLYFKPYDGLKPTQPYGGPQARSWYGDVKYGTDINDWYGHNGEGYWSNAIASKKVLTFAESSQYNVYAVEWKQGDTDGYIKFLLNDQLLLSIPASALKGRCDPDGNCVGDRDIPNEPLTFIFTMALAPSWAGGAAGLSEVPAHFYVDYIRWYQDPEKVSIGCDPKDYPTRKYIEANQKLYGPPALPTPPEEATYYFRSSLPIAKTLPSPTKTSPSSPDSPNSETPSPDIVNSDGSPQPTTTTTDNPDKSSFSGLSLTAKMGLIAGGSALLLALVAGLIIYAVRMSKRRNRHDDEHPEASGGAQQSHEETPKPAATTGTYNRTDSVSGPTSSTAATDAAQISSV